MVATDRKHWLKEGEPVAHITNLTFQMTIKELIYRRAEIFCEEDEPNAFFDTVNKRWVRNKKLLVGVRCRWAAASGGFECSDFHSKELVPWDVAIKGVDEVERFRKR